VENKQTRWWWVRHAPVQDSVRIYGQSDVDSDCSNEEIFKALAQQLPPEAVWLTSNLSRTHQTAAAIVTVMDEKLRPNDQPIAIPEFAEQNLGQWQGLVRTEFFAKRGGASYPLWFGPASERAPGGESFDDVVKRVGAAFLRLTEQYAGRDIISVAHGGSIKAALATALNLDPNSALAFSIDNCSVTRIDHLATKTGSDFWRVAMVNHRPWVQNALEAMKSNVAAPVA
jgi:alpha-ribazole phosphatase